MCPNLVSIISLFQQRERETTSSKGKIEHGSLLVSTWISFYSVSFLNVTGFELIEIGKKTTSREREREATVSFNTFNKKTLFSVTDFYSRARYTQPKKRENKVEKRFLFCIIIITKRSFRRKNKFPWKHVFLRRRRIYLAIYRIFTFSCTTFGLLLWEDRYAHSTTEMLQQWAAYERRTATQRQRGQDSRNIWYKFINCEWRMIWGVEWRVGVGMGIKTQFWRNVVHHF